MQRIACAAYGEFYVWTEKDRIGTLPIQIGVAMLVGVIYVGVGVDAFQGMLVRRLGCGDGGNGVPDTH